MKKYFNNQGITLVELVVVILIVGILSTSIYTTIKDVPHKARAAEFQTVLSGIYNAQKVYESENGNYSNDINELEIDFSGDSKWFKYSVECSDSTFTAIATVDKKFGKAAIGNTATINQSGKREVIGGLKKYAKKWD